MISDNKLTEEVGQVEEHPHLEVPQLSLQLLCSFSLELALPQQLFLTFLVEETSFLQELFSKPLPQAIAVLDIRNMPNKTNNIKWCFFISKKKLCKIN
ncbi:MULTISPECIES: hypothetical protein [unclassified Flavobacterium]|uniref:hypothetical protein n=1 Tax=unclassified Flavobacterium TaxID=196869 RepID=UPI00131E8374|nr:MULTISPECIES: hypothetical protein [unclassified Flavobacterium]